MCIDEENKKEESSSSGFGLLSGALSLIWSSQEEDKAEDEKDADSLKEEQMCRKIAQYVRERERETVVLPLFGRGARVCLIGY